jgi:outer membrane lipoprotein-sorting protein
MKAARLLMLSAALAGQPMAAHAGPPNAARLLEQAHAAAGSVPFSGREITVMWGRRETALTETQEFHGAHGRLRIETRRPRLARGRVVVDDGRNRWQYEPSQQRLYRQDSLVVEPGPPVTQLLQQYTATVAPEPKIVASRRAWRLEMSPRHPGKPVRRMWIDAATGLVLRYERARQDGRLLSASRFLEVQLGEPPASLFTRPGPPGIRAVSQHAQSKPLSLAAASARFGISLPASLPAGYCFAEATLLPGKGHPVAHLRYRDGLSAVSLYVGRWGSLPDDWTRGRSLRLRHGVGRLSTVRHLSVLSWRSPRAQFALVGDASPALLAQLAEGTAPALQAAPVALRLQMTASRWLLAVSLCLLAISAVSLVRRRRAHQRAGLTRRPTDYSQGWTG